MRERRKAIGAMQAAFTWRLGVGQEAVSRLETRGNLRPSTLRNMLETMGGELELIARFPGWPPAQDEAAQGDLGRWFPTIPEIRSL